jgi:hypothetical protein
MLLATVYVKGGRFALIMRSLRENVRWIMLVIVVVFVLSIFGMYGFGGRRSAPQQEGMRDYPVAQIDGKKIMRSSLENNVRDYVDRNNLKDVTSEDLAALRQGVLDNMVIQNELAKAVQKSGIKASDEEIDEVVKQISSQFPTKEAFQKYLNDSGIKMENLRANIGTQLAQQKLIEQSAGSVVVTSDDVREFYDKGKNVFFRQPAGRKVVFARFINQDVAAAMSMAVKKDNSQWDALLKNAASGDVKESISYDKPIFIAESGLQDKFASLKELPIGGVSSPIEIASNDYMVILNRENVEEKILSFDEVSGDIKTLLTNQKNQEAQRQYISGLKEEAKIEILDTTIFPQPVEAVKPAEANSQPVASGDQEPVSSEPASGDKK